MFGAEPQERWTLQEAAEFEAYAAERLHRMLRRAIWATTVFAATVLAVGPFLSGHSLHSHWARVGQNILLLALGELLWIVLWWGNVYAAWQSARDVRQEMADPE